MKSTFPIIPQRPEPQNWVEWLRLHEDEILRPLAIAGAVIVAAALIVGCAELGGPLDAPRMVPVETGPGQWLTVAVYAHTCYGSHTGARANLDSPGVPTVFLCHHAEDEPHELAHWKGMRHTAWDESPVAGCAWVIAPGYGTRYHAGDRICIARESRFEWIETRGAE